MIASYHMVMTTPISVEERLTLKARFPEDEDCALCLQSMKGRLVIRLPCGHHYHEPCHARLRNEAATYRYRCPCCRSDVKKQIQRLKVNELWGDNLWDQYQRNVLFERWIFEGLSEEELSDTQHVHSLQDPEVPPELEDQLDEAMGLGASVEIRDEYWEQYFAYLTESDEDESQPDSP